MKGSSFKHLIKTFKKGYGFDTHWSPENWHHEKIGTYSSDGNIPSIKGGIFIKGEFKDSLPKFLKLKGQWHQLLTLMQIYIHQQNVL